VTVQDQDSTLNQTPTRHTELRTGTIGPVGVLMQSIAQISPTLGVFYTIAFTTGQAGKAAPLTYLAAFVVCLMLAVPMVGLARHLPSAGGFYTFVSTGIGPKAGFITGWLYAVMVTIVPAALAAFTGEIISEELDSQFGLNLPWWPYALVVLAICLAAAYRGISISIKALVVMTTFEMIVGLGLALTGLVNPGPGGLNASGFNPGSITDGSAFFLAIVLSIFAFTGFESAAAVGEESRDPKRLVPFAIVGSLVLIGLFYCVTAWGLQIGWGTDDLKALADSPSAPAFVLADRLWGDHASLIVLIALVNSGLGVCIACTTSATRTLYGMARTGALPVTLAKVQPRHGTPIVAVLLQSGVALVVMLAAGLPMGAFNLFNTLGTTGTFVYIPIFILMNVAAFRFIRTQYPSEFSVARYVVAPVISTAALALIAYNSLNPLPDMPIRFAPLIALVYLLAGVAVLYGRNLKPGKTDWMARAGQLPDVD
jgi:amino acid transporter